jgi:thiol-disulfide isomerase/thioredoxin
MGHLPAQTSSNSLIGKEAPEIVLPKTDGTTARLIASGKGKKVILVFWATWCPHCYEELNTINESAASVENKGVKIILVDIGEAQEDVKNYLDRRQIRLTCFVDVDSALLGTYRLIGVPTLVFIDEKGIIRSMTHQFPSNYEDYFIGV